jgi:hypothetical protein
MNLRTKEWNDWEFNTYNLNVSFLRSEEIQKLVEEYSKVVESIVEKKKNKSDITNEINELNNIKRLIEKWQIEDIDRKNILKWTKKTDKRIWFWQDSLVYEFENNSKYVYKEGKEAGIEDVDYLRKKYKILQKYLGDLIPKSYFVLWESFTSLPENRWLKNGSYIATKSLTVQRKIEWKDASKMTTEEKRNTDFLLQLEKWHKKYVLLKLFLQSQLREMWLTKKDMDLQLDLGSLSNRDTFHHDEIDFIEWKLRSPNIMWDWKKLYFIDFGSWKWDKNKEKIFQKMMEESTFIKWKQTLEIYWLD